MSSEKFSLTIQIRWSDIDQNRHLRHSAYYDYAATARITYLNSRGLTSTEMETLNIGPVLFREEALFKREIRPEDRITLDVELLKATENFSRWSIRHHFTKADGTLAAILQVDGAWLDLAKRKLSKPPALVQEIFKTFPHAPEFEWMAGKS